MQNFMLNFENLAKVEFRDILLTGTGHRDRRFNGTVPAKPGRMVGLRMGTIPNGHKPELTQSRMGTIPNGHNPEWTQSRMSTYLVTEVFYTQAW